MQTGYDQVSGDPGVSEIYSYSSLFYNEGTLISKTGMGTYTYGDVNHPHAVTSTSTGWAFSYDANGNMTVRNPPGTPNYGMVYDQENRLTSVTGSANMTFTYDGDGKRVKSVSGSTTIAFVNGYFEWTGSTSTMVKYYAAGGTLIATRTGSGTATWLFSDHLGRELRRIE